MSPTLTRLAPLILLALFAALVGASWVGVIGSDDVTFARGAYGWLEQFPYVGGHGTIRYTLTVPMALSLHLLGENAPAMVLPSLLYLLAALAIVWRTVRGAADPNAANAVLLLLITLPLLVIQASIANVDMVELCFIMGSFALFWRCCEQGANTWRLLGAGACAGLGFLTRETAIFTAVFYAPLFFAGYRIARPHYLLIAAGFLGVWALELAYLGIMTGDPFYRFTIALNHDSTIDRSIDLAGNVIVNPLLDPLLVLLLNQEFMALFFAAIPLGLWLCFGAGIAPAPRRLARLTAWLGLSWFLCAGAVQSLLPLNPRYFTVPAVAACILAGLGLWALAQRGGKARLAAILGALALTGANLTGIAVENKDPLFGEHMLAAAAREYPGMILTDPATRYRADLLLRWQGARERVLGAPPAPGALYLYNPARTKDLPRYQPGPGWTKLREYALPMPLPARLLRAVGLEQALPPAVWRKLSAHHPPVTLYRAASK